MNGIPTNLVCMAAAFTVAVTVLLVGCVVDDSWWSLLTALCYLVALCCWLLFRPGCMPCMATPLPGAVASAAGCFGGNLCQQWGGFLTGFFGCSTFGLAGMLRHNEKTDTVSFVCSLLSGCLVMAIVVLEVRFGVIAGSSTTAARP